jgi:hypothetical protein
MVLSPDMKVNGEYTDYAVANSNKGYSCKFWMGHNITVRTIMLRNVKQGLEIDLPSTFGLFLSYQYPFMMSEVYMKMSEKDMFMCLLKTPFLSGKLNVGK